ncbi:regulatory protein RecX [Candidatus Ruminimicrobium bovinum]|uniref:regulatory protein RecX n=1 Tax=Candidatus Ruminimicrobium bovinum TaxID=3242779 RepID=UPI0039B8F871
MIKIFKIIKYPKIKNYFKVIFDNGSAVLLDAETIVLFGLKNNLSVDKDTFEKILKHNNSNKISSYAFYLISHKLYSKKGLTDKLLQKGFQIEDIEKTIARLCELNYINDENFAKELVKYLTSKGKGPFYIKNELKQHNIDDEIISKILNITQQEQETYLQIMNIMKKKYPKFNGTDKNETRKIAMYFQRRGFSSSDIAKAFREFENNNLY